MEWSAALFLLICLLWFTGMLLPWDQLALWVGRWSLGISARNALMDMYWTHTLVLSLLTLLFLTACGRRMRLDYVASA